MTPLRIMSVVAARPNFMKIAPLIRAIDGAMRSGAPLCHTLVHTGQHYDREMSAAFFEALAIPEPDVDLGIGSGSHAEQVGRTMMAFEPVVTEWRPDWIVVPGDVNATCACALTARKEHVNLAHIEAGLRSFDETMPEEINRIVTDRLSNLLFTTDETADRNLAREGVPPERIRRVGNIMIDTLEHNRAPAEALDPVAILAANLIEDAPPRDLERAVEDYALLTLHRPSNVDDRAPLERLVGLFREELAARRRVLWTVHPRTLERLNRYGLWDAVLACDSIVPLKPLGYREMLRLNMGARLMLTDSGGLQEECCVLGTPCITLRENTERPITLKEHGGLSVLTGNDVERIRQAVEDMEQTPRHEYRPPLWDGHTAERIAAVFTELSG